MKVKNNDEIRSFAAVIRRLVNLGQIGSAQSKFDKERALFSRTEYFRTLRAVRVNVLTYQLRLCSIEHVRQRRRRKTLRAVTCYQENTYLFKRERY